MLNIFTVPQIESEIDVLIDLIKKADFSDPDKNHYVFTPRNYSQTIERALYVKTEKHGSFNIHVTDLDKFFKSRIAADNDVRFLSRINAIILIKYIIDENKSKLKCFEKTRISVALAESIYDMIIRFKRSKLTPSDLIGNETVLDAISNELKPKLQDICAIYGKYEEKICGNFIDETDVLGRSFDFKSIFRSSVVYFIGFESFTAMEKSLFESICSSCGELNFMCLSLGSIGGKNAYAGKTVRRANELIDYLHCLTKTTGVNFREKRVNCAFSPLCSAAYSKLFFDDSPASPVSESISVYTADSVKDELTYIAKEIRKLALTGNIRYSDIHIEFPDANRYYNAIISIFFDYNIPFFLNNSIKLGSLPLPRFISDVFSAIRKNYPYEDVMRVVKSDLFDSTDSEKNSFENYCLKYSVSGKYLFNEFDQQSDADSDDEVDRRNKAEAVRKRLTELFSNMSPTGCVIGADYCFLLKERLFNGETKDKLLAKQQYLHENCIIYQERLIGQMLNHTVELIDKLDLSIGNIKMDFKEFCAVLESAFNIETIGFAPVELDCVQIGNQCSSLFSEPKAVFFADILEGFPKSYRSELILSQNNIEALESATATTLDFSENYVNDKNYASAIQLLLRKDANIFFSLSGDARTAKDSLPILLKKYFGLFSNVKFFDKKSFGKTERTIINSKKTNLIELIRFENSAQKTILGEKRSKLREDGISAVDYEDETIHFDMLKSSVLFDSESPQAAVYKRLSDHDYLHCEESGFDPKNTKLNVQGLFFRNKKTSVSSIERYYKCPYLHFLEKGLKLKDREIGDLSILDIGSLIHEILRDYIQNKYVNGNRDHSCKASCETAVSKPEYSRFFTKPSYYGKDAIIREAERVCSTLDAQLACSNFKPTHVEVEFGMRSDSAFPPIKIEGCNVGVYGIIDRIDVFKPIQPDRESAQSNDCDGYFRIIDYKTGSKTISFPDLIKGTQIQLFVYAYAIRTSTRSKPSGVYYFQISDSIKKSAPNDKAQEKTDLPITVSGLSLSDNAEVSDDISKTAGTASSASTISKENSDFFNSCIEIAIDRIKEAVNNIKNGDIGLTKDTANCKGCKYANVCNVASVTIKSKKLGKKDAVELIKGKGGKNE